MQLYISALLSLLVLLLLVSVFYLYKQLNLLMIKVNQQTYDLTMLQKGDSGNQDMQNVFGNMDMMNNFMNNIPNDEDDDCVDGECADDDCDDENCIDDASDDDASDDEGSDEEVSDDDSEVSDDEDASDADVIEELVDGDGTVEEIGDDDIAIEEISDDEPQPLVEEIKSSIKNVPNTQAKNFDVGHVELSSNDGSNYEVTATKNGIKRWKKMK